MALGPNVKVFSRFLGVRALLRGLYFDSARILNAHVAFLLEAYLAM